MGLADAEGVLQARLPDGARATDRLGALLPLELLVLALEVGGRKENCCLRTPASSFDLPNLVGSLCAQTDPPFALRPYLWRNRCSRVNFWQHNDRDREHPSVAREA